MSGIVFQRMVGDPVCCEENQPRTRLDDFLLTFGADETQFGPGETKDAVQQKIHSQAYPSMRVTDNQ